MNVFQFKTANGVQVDIEEFLHLKGRGIVFTGKLISLPDGTHTINSGELGMLLKGQILFNRPIIGVEMCATLSQHTGRSLGLLVNYDH